jgi:hypothetical protein
MERQKRFLNLNIRLHEWDFSSNPAESPLEKSGGFYLLFGFDIDILCLENIFNDGNIQ